MPRLGFLTKSERASATHTASTDQVKEKRTALTKNCRSYPGNAGDVIAAKTVNQLRSRGPGTAREYGNYYVGMVFASCPDELFSHRGGSHWWISHN
jgi:hypothetical protein